MEMRVQRQCQAEFIATGNTKLGLRSSDFVQNVFRRNEKTSE